MVIKWSSYTSSILLSKVTSCKSSVLIQPKQQNLSSFISFPVNNSWLWLSSNLKRMYSHPLCYWNVASYKNSMLRSLIFFRILLEGNFWNIFRRQFVRGFIWTDFRGINCTLQRLAWRTPNVKERHSVSSVQHWHHAAQSRHYLHCLGVAASVSTSGFTDRNGKKKYFYNNFTEN